MGVLLKEEQRRKDVDELEVLHLVLSINLARLRVLGDRLEPHGQRYMGLAIAAQRLRRVVEMVEGSLEHLRMEG